MQSRTSKLKSLLALAGIGMADPIPAEVSEQARFAEYLLARDGVRDDVIDAMLAVPRHEFVQAKLRADAYEDIPLPIGNHGTISQPSLVAKMISMLEIGAGKAGTVLDVGSGSGYTSAILASLADHVVAVERVEALANQCAARLNRLGFTNIDVVNAKDDVLGYPDYAPYDAILVSAGAPDVPASLAAQLATGARMVIPIGERRSQRLATATKHGDGPDQFNTTYSSDCRFVPLIGPEAWPEQVLDIP